MSFEGAFIVKGVFTEEELQTINSEDASCDITHPRVLECVSYILKTMSFYTSHKERIKFAQNVETRTWRLGSPYEQLQKRKGLTSIEFDDEVPRAAQIHIPHCNLTLDNGAYMYVPNSHLSFQYPANERLLHGSFVERNNPLVVHPCKKKTLTCEKGDVLVFASSLWFSYGKNSTKDDTIIDTFTCSIL